ncbi:hypothetical protein CK498_14550 [Halomonas salipaludis]|uniref:Uncharacterized protein n=1 Tax=Halomonas salipaludis TaxID=2032625 RepID=A0A2A2ERQ8_9GAMM|nr:hypothetical protein CK498_14550 [Halomonas salipaludis]
MRTNATGIWPGQGEQPSPSRGRQTEVGAKLSLPDGRLGPTLGLFDIRRRNGVGYVDRRTS